MQEIVENHGQSVYIPTSGMCFIKCIIYFTNSDCTEELRDFIINEKTCSGERHLLEFNYFVKNVISASVCLMERE